MTDPCGTHMGGNFSNYILLCSKDCEISNFGFSAYAVKWDYMGVHVSNDISSEIIAKICSQKFMCTSGEALYQKLLKRL